MGSVIGRRPAAKATSNEAEAVAVPTNKPVSTPVIVQAAACAPQKPTAPCILALHCERLEWTNTSAATTGQDYTYSRETAVTGRLLDGGIHSRDAELLDLRPHDSSGGILLGQEGFGRYLQDDGKRTEVMGTVRMQPVCLAKGGAISAAIVLRYTGPPRDGTLLYLGNGWCDHFTVRHYRGKLRFQVCREWGQRQEVACAVQTEAGSLRCILAVLDASGGQQLFVDGVLAAEGQGLRADAGFSPAKMAQERGEAFVGRWMRPDQSDALAAAFVSLELFDGALGAEEASALNSRAVASAGNAVPFEEE